MDILHLVTFAVLLASPVVTATFGYLGPYPSGIESYRYQFPRTLFNGYNYQPFLNSPFYNGIASPLAQQVPAIATSRLIYSSSAYRGYSYQNNYGHGGRSDTVFITGPDSHKLMLDSIESLQKQISELTKGFLIPASTNTTNNSLPTSTKSQESSDTSDLHSQPEPIKHTTASAYHIQIHPGSISTLFGPPIPYHSIVSYYLTTPDARNNEKGGAEAEESMIREIGVAPPTSANEQELISERSFPTIELNNIESSAPEGGVSSNNSITEKSNDSNEVAQTTISSIEDAGSSSTSSTTSSEGTSQDNTATQIPEEPSTTSEGSQETTTPAAAETTEKP